MENSKKQVQNKTQNYEEPYTFLSKICRHREHININNYNDNNKNIYIYIYIYKERKKRERIKNYKHIFEA